MTQYQSATATFVSEVTMESERTSRHHGRKPKAELPFPEVSIKLRRGILILVAALLLVLPICFGAVHPTAHLVSESLIFLTVGALFAFGTPLLEVALAKGTTTRTTILAFSAFLFWAAMSFVGRELMTAPHPVLGNASLNFNFDGALSGIFDIASFIAVILLARVASTLDSTQVIKFIVSSGVVVSLIAIAHWFYDNGLLFWVFEPDYIQLSTRARWPFVNSNHLGHFLLPSFFLLVSIFFKKCDAIKALRIIRGAEKEPIWGLLTASKTFQGQILGIAFTLVSLLSVTIAILGAQSRSTWLGFSIGILCTVIGSKFIPPFVRPARAVSMLERRHPSRENRKRHRRGKDGGIIEFDLSTLLPKLGKPLALLGALMILYLFLSEKGVELVANRLDYGLLHSKDDMRWQLYQDTVGMIREHTLLGVGLAGWAVEFPRYMNSLLAGINPVYLHSDPMQLLAELGLVGAILVALAVWPPVTAALRVIPQTSNRDSSRELLALLVSLITVGTASFLDFPFRIPAIAALVAVLLGATLFRVDGFTKREPEL